MLRRLRTQLTALYLLAACILMLLIGGGAYRLLDYYFQSSTDLTLQYKMALAFQSLEIALPPELETASRDWNADRNHLPTAAATPQPATGESETGSDETHEAGGEEVYNSELASVFLSPLDQAGTRIAGTNAPKPPLVDGPAAQAALAQGLDWRTVSRPDGTRIRLLSYRLPGSGHVAVLQAGRALDDQDRVLRQLLLGLLGLGGLCVVLVGAGSWWLAGRSLMPAQLAWDRQQTFVANASHELRAPLTLMRASAEVAQRSLPADDERHQLLGDVLQECDHMSRLVNDLLLLSRLDAGQLALARQPIALPELLADIQRQMGRVTQIHQVDLILGASDGVVLGDPTRFRQVILILLDNALQHTPAGGVIRLETRPTGRRIELRVMDTGSGISPHHLPHVFDRFYRGTETQLGSGLGLAIAKSLVEAQHGRIAIASSVGQGTTFTITLPKARDTVSDTPRSGRFRARLQRITHTPTPPAH